MPQKIQMSMGIYNNVVQLNNIVGSLNRQTIENTNAMRVANAPSLSAPMINRIHSIKPGCGSCGKH